MFKFEDNDNKVFCIKDSNVELSATFETLPKDLDTITIEWTRDGKPITNSEKFKVTKTKNAIQLAIQHVQRDDAGHYTLYAKTDTGETAQKDIELLVEDRSFGDNPPVFLRRLNDLAVKVGTRTRLLVEIRSATDVRVTWYRNDRRICENDRINFVNEGSFYCLEISSITLDDGGKWMCMAENLGGRNSCLATLNVLVPKAYKAPEFVEELRAILTEQGTVSLECKVVGVPTPILRWFKDSKEIKAGDVFALTANPDDLTSLGTYTCEAINCMGKTYSSSKLHISGKTSREGSLQPPSKPHGPPPIFTSELKNINSKIGDTITLGCQVMVPPWPKSVTWYNKEGKVESSEKYKLIEDGLGSYILEIKPAEYSDEGEWKFVVASNEGTVSISTCSVHMDIPKNYRKPRFMENLKAILTEEGLVSFECKVVGFPTPLLRWFKDGHELKPGDVYQLTGTNSLGSYSCIARNCMGEACSSAVLTLEDIQNQLNENERIELQQKNQPPKFIKGLMSCETKINEEFKFTVQIKATTEPVFSWYRDDLPIDKANERFEISTEKVGFCHLTIKYVEFVDQAEWKCVATNEFGHSTSTCFLKLQIPRHYKKPRFLECLRAVLTEEGAVNLECKVIGVPQPTLRWFKDGVELKPGDIHRIISGKDGECSLGTYTCEARNCMGVVTSSATLLGYEENYKSIPKPEPANILQRHLSLSTIHEERTSQLYDTPMGDITVDEKGDVSFSFDGKEVSVSLYETPDLTEEEALQIVEMYADQISEHVTEQNIVELPPLRFVKETTQSGNLLMEAVVIDVSPDYFPPEEDMRTEADMEDISVVDPMSQAFEDPLSEQSHSKRRRKEESLKSGEVEEFFSLSQSKQTKPLSVLENYVVEEAHSDEEITETDLQTFESAKSSEKGDSDKQKKVIKSDDSLQEQPPKLPPRKRPPAADSRDEDSVYLQDISGEQGDGLKTQTKKKIDVKTITINKSIIEKVIKTVIIVEQHLIAVENEVIAQSSLMMSPTSGDSSIGIVKSVLEPINAIECKVNEYNGERNVDNLVENLMPDLKSLNHGLSIIEKCVEMDSEGKTLVQRTSVCVIESVGIQMLAFLESLKQVCLHNVQGSLQNESLLIINDMQTGIHITEDTIKSQTLIQEATALEASQRVSETVAQMQQNMPETVPLEIVTTAELPKEANSFKLLCRYILKFQEILETSQQSDVKKETLAEIQKPIIAIQNEIHSIEEKISKNSLKDTIEEKISFKILDTVSPPLYELNKCFEAITKNIESGIKSPKILDPFILPLQEIQTGLALIGHEIDSGFIKKESPIDTEDNQKLIKNVSQNVIYVESNIENIRDSTSMTVYDSLIQLKVTISTLVNKIIREPLTKGNLQIIWALKIPLEELNYCFRHIEERSTSGSLRDLLDPLNSLKENMEVVEEKLRQMRISSNVEEINKIKNLVDQCDAEIQLFDIIQLDHQERMNEKKMLEQQLSEHSQHLSEMQQRSIWKQEKCDVLTNVQQNIVNIQEIILFEKDKSFSEQLSTLKTLANPLRELSRQIANIREEILLENVNDISINDYKAILKLANPIREICQQLAVITKASTFESAQVFSSKSDQDSLKSIAVPLAELRNCIAAIQHECITLHEIQGEISHPQISLKTARPLEELRLRVEEIIHNIVEPDEISATLDDVSVMKTMSEMSDEVKVESSKHVVKVTETKVETAYMEKKVIEIKQLDVEASDIDEKKSLESQQHTDIKTDVETAENIEKVAEQKSEKLNETLKVTEEELSKIIETSKQDIFEPQEQKFSQEIQTYLLKMKEEMETVMIAVQNMSRPTPEVQTIEKELKSVLDHVSNLPNSVNEMNKIIKIIDSAEKSISIRKTSDVILVKYNLESLKKTLKIIIKIIYPEHVDKKEEVQENKEIVTEKIESTENKTETMEVQIVEKITKVDIQQGISEPKVDITASVSQAENQVKKVKILIKKISTFPELQAAEQELAIAFENLTDITTNSEKFDKAIEVINVVESKLMAEKSSNLVEIRENLTTLKQILIILKSSVSTQQVKIEENKEQVHATELQVIEVPDSLKIVESIDAKIERINESAIKPILTEKVELTDKIEEIKLLETNESKSLDNLESKSLEIVESKPLEIVETKSEELKIIEITQTELAVQPGLKDKVQEFITESTSNNIKETQIEELKIAEVQTTEEKVSQIEATIFEKIEKQVVEIKECTVEKIDQTLVEITQQILPEIQECLTKIKENVETVSISIKNTRRPTDELKDIEKELTIILQNISELAQNQQQIEKVIKKIDAAEASLVARKTSDIVIVKENLILLKTSLISLNNPVNAQKVEIIDIEAKSQSAEIEIIESKEELQIIEDIKSIVTEEIKSDENQAEIEKSTSITVESTAEKIDQTFVEIKEPTEPKIQEATQQILPEIQECLTKTKENAETVSISIKNTRRPTDELKDVEKELTIILQNISELAQNQQQIEKVIKKIDAAEASLVARKTSDIVIVKENLILLKTSLISLNNPVNAQKVEIIDIEAKSQSAEIEIIESKEELQIIEDIKSIVTEEIKSDENQAEIEKSTSITVESTAEKIDQTFLEIKEPIEPKIQEATQQILPEIQECLTKIKENVETVSISIKKARRPTDELKAAEKELTIILENISELAQNQQQVEKVIEKIDAAEASLVARKTSDIVIVKENLILLKTSLISLNNAVNAQKVEMIDIEAKSQSAEIEIIESKEELQIIEDIKSIVTEEIKSDENQAEIEKSTSITVESTAEKIDQTFVEIKEPTEPKIQEATQQILPEIQECLTKTKENAETASISIKKARRPTDELKAAEKELTIILENISELAQNQQQVEKVIEKIDAAEASLVARKTSDIVIVKENLILLKTSLISLNNAVNAQKVEIIDIEAKSQSAEIEIIESKEELQIIEDIKSIVTDEIKSEAVKSDEKQAEIEKSTIIPDLKELNDEKSSDIQVESPHTEVKLQPEVEQCLLKTKDEIETVTMSIKKVRRTTSELESVQSQLNVALENIRKLPENVQQVEKIIELIEKAEASLLARKTSDIIIVKESLSNLKQSLVILTNAIKSHKVKVGELKPKTHIADLQIIETSEELKIVESNECIAEKVEETFPEKIEENVPENADTKLQDSIQNKQEQMAEILPVEQIEKECEKSIESIEIVEQNASESIEFEKCIEKSKEEIAHTIESIHKVRRKTPEIQAIERQLSTTFENVMEIRNNDKIIEEILNKIEAVEESIAIRRTSDISDLKGNLINLKQSLVTLKTVIVQHNSQIQTSGAQPQQAVISVIETKEELQVTEPCEEEKKELTKVYEKPIIGVEHAEEKPTVIEEITEHKVENVSEILNEITVYLTNTKTEIENVTASVKKVRNPTTELQAAQEELKTALEKLENLPENPEQIEKVIQTIEKAEVSLVSKKTSDNYIVKDNLTKLKQTLVLLNSTIKAQKGEIIEISQIPQVSDLKIIETLDELKIVESNESLAEKVKEKVIEKIEEKTVDKSIIIETPEIPTEQSQKEQVKTGEQEISKTKIVEQNEQITPEPAELQICLEKSKEEVGQAIESIKKVRRTTPEIQAIEKQLSTTFENIMEIASNDKTIEDILCKIEAAETSITTRKTTDIVLLKGNFSALKQSLVMLKSVILQQNVHVKSIDLKPQQADIGVIETQTKNELKVEDSKEEIIINEKVIEEVLKITEDVKKSEEQKPAEEIKVIESEKIEHKKSEEDKVEGITKIEESKPEKELISTSETATQKILPQIQEYLGKTKENIETVTILIKKARRPTDELQAAEKELTTILENISELAQNQQQIEKVIEKIETAEASLVARKTSDIVLVKENLTSLKQSLVTLNNTIKTHNTLLSTVMETPQIGNLKIIEVSEELKIVESNESLAERVDDKINKISQDVEIINETAKEIEKSENKTKGLEKPKEPEILNEPVVEISAESKLQEDIQKTNEIIVQKQEPTVETSEDVNVDFCIKQSKTEIENTMASIKFAKRPTPELQATEKDLVLTLQQLSDLPANEVLIEKAISSIESAATSLVSKKTSDIVLVKQNLSILKESFEKLKNTIKDVPTVKQSADLQIIEPSEDLKIVESNENISAAVQPVEKIIEKSKVEIKNTVESIKKVQKPTAELQETEKELETALEHLSDLQHDKRIIVKVIESIAAAETSLTAKKTSDVALIKENLSQLKESLTTLKTNVEEFNLKKDLPVVEPSNDLKIIESNEDLTVTDETPKIEELEGLQITESEQLTEVTLSLAKSRDEIENVMYAIRKARHPPTEVCAVEKILTSTYEQLFELPKDEKFIDKAIESIELAEISLVPRGAGDLIVIKNNLEVLKQSLIKIISYTNPQKAESLLHEIQKPQVAKVSEIQEQKPVEEEKLQELTNKQTLEKLIEKSVELIRSSRRPTPEMQAIEKTFTLTIENVSNLENDKQEIEKVIELIETAEASLAEKRTSDIVLIKENLAIVKETLNTLKLTAKSKPIEIIELQQQKPEHAIIVDEKLKKEELEKEIVDKKSVEKQQESIELKESEAQLPLQTEIQETQKQQPNETVEKLKTEIVSTIESIKKVRRPNPEIQAVERELTMTIEHVNELPNDEKKIEKVIAIIENTEASLVAKRTSDIAVVKNNLSELKQTLNVMKTVVEPSTNKVGEIKILEVAQAEQKITSEVVNEKSNENLKIKENIIEKISVIEKISTEKPLLDEKTKLDTEKPVLDQKSPEGSKDEKLVKAATTDLNVEKILLSENLVNLKSNIEGSIQSIKKALHPTSELEDTEKILSIAFENVSDFADNVVDVQKAIESIIVAEVSLIAKRTSDMVLIKSCLGNLKEKLTVVKNNLKPQKPEIMGKEEPKKASIEDEPKKVDEKTKKEQKKIEEKSGEELKKVEEPKKVEEKHKEEPKIVDEEPKEEPKKIDKKPKEEQKKIDEKPKEEPKKIDEKPKEEQKKIDEKPKEEQKKIEEKLPAELKKVKIEIVDAIDSIKKIRRATTELNFVENEFKTVLEHIKEIPNNQQGLLNIISSIEAAETSLATRRTSDIMILKEKLNSLKGSLSTFKIVENIDEVKVESLKLESEIKKEIRSEEVKVDSIIEPKQEKEKETPKIDDSQSKEIVKGTEEDVPKDEIESKKNLKPNETEKPKSETIICEESPKLEEKPKISESAIIRKLRTAIENVSTTIKKIRRPTPELQTVDVELTIIIKKLPEFENEIEKIDEKITLIVKAEDSIITKKTSDMLAVKESLSKIKNTLTEIRDSIKPNIETPKETEKLIEKEKSKDIEQVQELVTKNDNVEEKVESKMEDIAKSMEVNLSVDETKLKDNIKSKEDLKSSVTEQPKEVQKPEEQLIVEEKPKVPESATVQRLRTEIENVSATIKKVRRPTSELQSAENELAIVIKKLSEFENDVEEIDKIIKVINRTEDSIITKKTSDMIAVKENILSLKNILTELSELKKPKIEKPKSEEKLKTVKQIQEKTEKKIEPEISVKSQKLEQKPSDVKITEEPTKSNEEPLGLKIEKAEVKEQIPEIRLNEISLKIKSEIENVIHSIKKSRRPTSELQSLEKSLNDILDLKIIAELPMSLKRIEETLKSIDVTESSLESKKTSDMILVKNNINLLKEVLVSCMNKLDQAQETKAVIKPADITEDPTFKEETPKKEIESEKPKIPELPKEFEQPSEVLLDIHEKDLMFQYIIGIKQDIEEVLVMIKKARRPSTELQTLHESLIDLKPKVDNLTKDSAYFDAVLHIVTKAKSALLTKRTMDMILLREKVTSLESSLTLLKSTIVTEINGEIIAAKQEKVTEKTKMEEKVSEKMEIDSIEQKVRTSEEKKEIIEEVKTEIQVTKDEEISREPIKHDELEPQKPVRRRKQEEPAKIEEDKIETKPEPIKKEESKPQITVEPEIAPVPTERRRQQKAQDNSVEIKRETEPIKPSRQRRAEQLKEEEKSLPRTPETRRKRMPIFIARLKNRSAPENSILKLTCAVSEPEVTARWTKQGMILKDSEKYSIENSNGVLSIEIKNACAQDAGEYYCFVSNSCGEIETSAFITIFGEDVQPSHATFTKNLKGEFMTHYFNFFAIVGFM